jgi:hypothetical protein
MNPRILYSYNKEDVELILDCVKDKEIKAAQYKSDLETVQKYYAEAMLQLNNLYHEIFRLIKQL